MDLRAAQIDPTEWDALMQRDNAAWARFFAEHDPLINSVIAWPRWSLDIDTREDLAQAIRAELPNALPGYRGDCPVAQFIKRICINRCIDRVRKQVRLRGITTSLTIEDGAGGTREWDFPAKDGYNPVNRIVLAERIAGLNKLLDRLDGKCASAIQQFYGEGHSYKEMAENLGLSINTVGSRLAKCLEKLRKMARGEVEIDGE